MARVALILGILGGLVLLFYGVFGYGIGSLASGLNVDETEASIWKVLAIALPVVAFVGAGIVSSRPWPAALLLGLVALVTAVKFGFNGLTFIPVIMLATAAVMAAVSASGQKS